MPRFTIRVKPGASRNAVIECPDVYTVYTTAKAVAGAANRAVLKQLAAHFKVAPSQITIILGKTAREKLIEIN